MLLCMVKKESKIPVITCTANDLSLNGTCLSKFSQSIKLRDPRLECASPFFFALFEGAKLFEKPWLSILRRCSCNAWTASAAWRPCKSSLEISLSLFLILNIFVAASELSLSALCHSSLALAECCWAEKCSPFRKAFAAALECRDADLFNYWT